MFFFVLGINDPVADKLLKRAAAMPALPPPEDKTITTLYIGNLGTLSEQDIRYMFLILFFSKLHHFCFVTGIISINMGKFDQ